MIARLTCLDDSRLPDDQKGLIIELDGSEVSIGRGVDNTQVIQHSSISRRHALIVPDDAGLLIRDLKSTNGVWLNGERTDEALLGNGDTVGFGSLLFRFETVEEVAEEPDEVEPVVPEPELKPVVESETESESEPDVTPEPVPAPQAEPEVEVEEAAQPEPQAEDVSLRMTAKKPWTRPCFSVTPVQARPFSMPESGTRKRMMFRKRSLFAAKSLNRLLSRIHHSNRKSPGLRLPESIWPWREPLS